MRRSSFRVSAWSISSVGSPDPLRASSVYCNPGCRSLFDGPPEGSKIKGRSVCFILRWMKEKKELMSSNGFTVHLVVVATQDGVSQWMDGSFVYIQ
ncbi:uncharacterized protein BO88DRAFT_405457 [Aspergillus vadensis CBS 113365]|uniref:Uncharacterized protein n=1 Tax=Aspergillus vadensis (strain CBS 113365 / IMI 142717 / IBT 24658) TaxID=1448311 RepID=A0A319B8B6_ASPVC|nr:hypothetical protein BO88DRAFT_405457 [Aspergillus vadensis CBS 113365]PYH68599.1 hypothetical protein BO88DRAFT_405457 [Aspergillus vadensis CBS 113365]